MTSPPISDSALPIVCAEEAVVVPPPETTSDSMQEYSEKVAQFLVIARNRTVNEGEDFLEGLSSARGVLVKEFGGKEITLQTLDKESINGLHFEGAQKKGIIYLHGNGGFYETSAQKPLDWVRALKQTATGGIATFPHLVVFNPRGTGKSEGVTHPENVARDMLAAFEYLVNKHAIDPSDIVIVGHSLGGFFGAFGAELVQQTFPDSKINFISDRSYSDIHSRVDSLIKYWNNSGIVNPIFSSNMHALITLLNWNKNPVAALEKLKGRVCIIYHKGDGVIPYHTSLHLAITNAKRTRNYSCLSLKEEQGAVGAHNRLFTEEEHNKVIAEMKKMLGIPFAEEEKLGLDVLAID